VVTDVEKKTLGDRMESFFLAETCKYLYLLFDPDNFVHMGNYIFNTEGHLIPLLYKFSEPISGKAPDEEKLVLPAIKWGCEEPTYLQKLSNGMLPTLRGMGFVSGGTLTDLR
jgi:hypothetical protein